MEKRIIYSDNGTLSDCSTSLNNYHSGTKTFSYVAGEDYIYIGTRLPFNHFYFKLATPSVVGSVSTTVDYWNGEEWISAVEVIDETSGFTSSGFITFTPNRDESWSMESTNYAGESITGLSTLNIYDLYWVRISFSANLTASTILSWIGNKFSDDNDLGAEFPDLERSTVKTSFETGKTSWEEQHVITAKIITDDLVNKGIIEGEGQIINREEYREASVMKTAEIIFSAFGDDYTDQKINAREEYNRRLSKRIHKVDLNNNAIEDNKERFNKTGFLSR